ncbi:MAG: hypothetical protein OXF20_05105 [Gammaproteobacteria bacterium]|nr:hypothetical protein [Gammaproteobacteria bacterium]
MIKAIPAKAIPAKAIPAKAIPAPLYIALLVTSVFYIIYIEACIEQGKELTPMQKAIYKVLKSILCTDIKILMRIYNALKSTGKN